MKKMYSIICFVLFVGNLPISLNSQTTTEKLNQELNTIFQNSDIPGVALAIVSKDKICLLYTSDAADE